MTTAQHTPGPWSRGATYATTLFGADGAVIAHATQYRCGEQVALANARLIAAAPTLLSAANEAFDFLGGIDGAAEIRDTLLAAILAAAQPKEINP